METEFLLDCDQYPMDPVRVRYRRLGLSAERGTRLKDALIAQELLGSALIPVGRTKKLILRPTHAARQATRGRESSASESIEHAFWKEFYFQKYRALGYEVRKEAPRVGGRVDLIAENRLEKIGVEIETGKSDALRNVQNCLNSGFSKVLVVATDETAREAILRRLIKGGLQKNARVRIRVRDRQDR